MIIVNREYVAYNLRKLMNGMSQRDFSQKTGVSKSSIGRYLLQQGTIREEQAYKICKACGVPSTYLYRKPNVKLYGGYTKEEAMSMLMSCITG